MKVLLVNPNRYKFPPVPPIGLEYLAASLEEGGHEVQILDLCFAEDIRKDIDVSVGSFRPDVAGVTVRNVDTCLFQTNEFFLDGIRDVVSYLKTTYGLRVIVGGTGVSSNPSGIVEYLGADCAIRGPAEDTVHEALQFLQRPGKREKVFMGKCSGRTRGRRNASSIDYKNYCGAGGVVGFETHKGCTSSCHFCLEANTPVNFKKPSDVVREIGAFVERGYTHFHLCDSEFNENLDYSTEFASSVKKAGMGIKWAVYMKPSNFSRTLFKVMQESGVYLITLSVDSYRKCPLYWTDYEKFVFGAKSVGIKVAVDFLTGFPFETDDDLKEYFDTLRRPVPDSVGVNTYIRLYKSLQITHLILREEELKGYLLGNTADRTLLQPVFYNHVDTDQLGQLIDEDPLFRVEGLERGVNYGRTK